MDSALFIFILITIIFIMAVFNVNDVSYFGSGPIIFTPNDRYDLSLDNDKLEPLYQKIKLKSYL